MSRVHLSNVMGQLRLALLSLLDKVARTGLHSPSTLLMELAVQIPLEVEVTYQET